MKYKKETKNCQNCKKDFVIKPDDFGFYEKIDVPPPTFCEECRLIRRLAWRNENSLYNRNCSLCKDKMVTIFAQEKKEKVYCSKCWWGDSWDARDYAMDIDFSRPFFEQLFELFHMVPVLNLFAIGPTMINSPYCNMANDMRNCYLLHDGTFDENISYSSGVFHSKDSQDITLSLRAELCYEVVATVNCYQTFYSQQCDDCIEVYFSRNLRGCTNCFGCVNLNNKSYHIFNEPYTKEKYHEKLKSFNLDSYKSICDIQEKVQDFWVRFPRKYYYGTQNVNFTGDYIINSKNVRSCFFSGNIEDSKFCSFTSNGPIRTTYDFTHYGDNIELTYESLQSGNGLNNVKFGWGNWSQLKNSNYSIMSNGSSDIFGCVGIRKKQCCILNKQYTKEEYEKLLPKIIKHMNDMPYVDKKGRVYKYGEFYPIEFSPFGYNETTAQEYFPLTQEQAKGQGYSWQSKQDRNYKITKQSTDLSDSINDISDSILNEIVACEHKGKCEENCMTAFRILPEDLKFYRRMNIPLPRQCPNCRRHKRMKQRNPMKLWHRQCMCEKGSHEHEGRCKTEFKTTYSPERTEVVYCETCYQKEVY